jgi:hypothetical protein
MSKKLRNGLDFVDVKSIVGAVIVLVIAGGFLIYRYNFADKTREYWKEKYKGKAECRVLNCQPVQIMHQGRYGNKISLDHFIVTYRYEINGVGFTGTDEIPNTAENLKLIDKIMKRSTNDNFPIQFDIETPDKSILIN